MRMYPIPNSRRTNFRRQSGQDRGWRDYVIHSGLVDTVFQLSRNIRRDIQFDHVPADIRNELSNSGYASFGGIRIIASVLNNVLSGKIPDGFSTLEYLVNRINRLETLRNEPDAMSRLDSSINFNVSRASIASAMGICDITPRKSLVVPKNTDLATLEYRIFRLKPFIAEAILTHFCRTILKQNLVDFENDTVMCFGGGFRLPTEGSSKAAYNNYIVEYNDWQEIIIARSEKFSLVKTLDLRKFFDSIQHSTVAEIFEDHLSHSGKSRNIRRNSKQLVTELLAYSEISPGLGLSIESHTQHTLAMVVVRTLLNEARYRINRILESQSIQSDQYSITVYIDDFVVHANEPHVIDVVQEILEDTFKEEGLTFSAEKESPIMESSSAILKKLVQLPANIYFEILMEPDQEQSLTYHFQSFLETLGAEDAHPELEHTRQRVHSFYEDTTMMEAASKPHHLHTPEIRQAISTLPWVFRSKIRLAEQGYSPSRLQIKDLDFWYVNRQNFVYQVGRYSDFITDPHAHADKTLEVLQYFFLTVPHGTDHTTLLGEVTMLTQSLLTDNNFGSKVRFLQGIARRAGSSLGDFAITVPISMARSLAQKILDNGNGGDLESSITEPKDDIRAECDAMLEYAHQIFSTEDKDQLDFSQLNLAYYITRIFKPVNGYPRSELDRGLMMRYRAFISRTTL